MSNKSEFYIDGIGNKRWYFNGKFHREGGPAIEYNDGCKQWFINGKLHRVDGPAIIYPDGYIAWCLNGRHYSKEEWFQQLTPEHQYNYLWSLDEQ
jgi:hypothetical protein